MTGVIKRDRGFFLICIMLVGSFLCLPAKANLDGNLQQATLSSPADENIQTSNQLMNVTEVCDLISSEFLILPSKYKAEYRLNLTLLRNEIEWAEGNYYLDLTIASNDWNTSTTLRGPIGTYLEKIELLETFRLVFNQSILVGNMITVALSGSLLINQIGNNTYLQPGIIIASPIAFMQNVFHLPFDMNLLGLSPNAHSITSTPLYSKYFWNYANRKNFVANISYSQSYNSSFHTNFSGFQKTVAKSQTASANLTVSNIGSLPGRIKIIAPEWFILASNNLENTSNIATITLLANSSINITIQSKDNLQVGTYSGVIYVINRDQIIASLPFSFKIVEAGAFAFAISLISFILLMLGLSFFVYTKFTRKMEKEELSKVNAGIQVETEPKKTDNSEKEVSPDKVVSLPANVSVDFEKIRKLMNMREFEIIKYIDQNPGTSQQAIANYLDTSKATLSRVLKKLEGRGIIRREPHGMSNSLFLNYKYLPRK